MRFECDYSHLVRLDRRRAAQRPAARMYGLVAEDAAPGGATAMARCRDTVERMQGRIRAEDLFAMPATSSASGFKTKSTVGMILNGCTIDSLVVGGPVRDARAARACLSASAAAGRRAGGGRDWGTRIWTHGGHGGCAGGARRVGWVRTRSLSDGAAPELLNPGCGTTHTRTRARANKHAHANTNTRRRTPAASSIATI